MGRWDGLEERARYYMEAWQDRAAVRAAAQTVLGQPFNPGVPTVTGVTTGGVDRRELLERRRLLVSGAEP
jgi:hypothetical protein